MQLGYSLQQTMKVIRTRHTVMICDGNRAKSIKEWLSKVPDDACLTITSDGDDNAAMCLIFEQEVEEPQSGG